MISEFGHCPIYAHKSFFSPSAGIIIMITCASVMMNYGCKSDYNFNNCNTGINADKIIKNNKLKKTEQHKKSQVKELDFNEKLATKTMYNLLLLQKEYSSAKSILLLMRKLKNNSDFVNKEMKNINQLINGEN